MPTWTSSFDLVLRETFVYEMWWVLTSESTRGSFLGDSHFPQVAIESSRGGKIRLYQELYSQYSRLAFTRQEDRPLAIAGLEKRLIHSFKVRGGFGVLDDAALGLLRRSLLWHRAPDTARLETIDFCRASGLLAVTSSVSSPPTWSWMAYKGAIMYMDAPFGRVEWEGEDVCSPWSSSAVGTWSYSGDRPNDTLVLRVNSRAFEARAAGGPGEASIILDAPIVTDKPGAGLRCVVLGRMKSLQGSPDDRIHFVLLVKLEGSQSVAAGSSGSRTFRRMGIGRMPGNWIRWDEPVISGQVR